ncbi:hypothetical protein [Dyella sp. A6]|uniref:hypothetical protein n=1 Tax=Dyella aluminiiresistens TaxID=3069105 RepID=UPI002E79203C|nr:hypothetical protein [Dyella sp. A6]
MNDITIEAAQQALVRLLAIADRLDARNRQAAQDIEAAVSAMRQGVERLDRSGDQFAQQALQRVSADVQQSIAQGVDQAAGRLQCQLQQSAHSAQLAAKAMLEQRKGLSAARRALVWSGTLALLVGVLLAVAGAAWVAHRSMQDVAQAHFSDDILRATRSGAITRCGDALCARVGKHPKRYDKAGDYVLLDE